MGKFETPDYVLDDQVGHLLRRANQRHAALFAKIFDDHDLTPLQFAVLMRLDGVGELSQNHLGRLTAMDPNTTKGVVSRLLDRDLLTRRKCIDDKRRFRLTLSEKGHLLAERLKDAGNHVSRETLAPFTNTEKATFLKLLKRIV